MIAPRAFAWSGLVLALLIGCFLPGCKAPEEPLRIGYNPWPAFGLLQLAEAKGFFKEEGAQVRLFVTGSLSETRRAYETGKLDGMASTMVEVLIARDEARRDPRIVRVLDFSHGADVILAPKRIRSVADLKDKTVGVELASVGVFILSRALGDADLHLDDVNIASKDPSVMMDDLLEGRIDAVVAYPPESLRVADNGRFHTLFCSADIPGEVVDVISVDRSVLASRPAQVSAFLRALDRAQNFLMEEPLEASRIMGRPFGLEPEPFLELLSHGIKLVPPQQQDEYLSAEGRLAGVIRSVGRALQQARLLSSAPEPRDILPGP